MCGVGIQVTYSSAGALVGASPVSLWISYTPQIVAASAHVNTVAAFIEARIILCLVPITVYLNYIMHKSQ